MDLVEHLLFLQIFDRQRIFYTLGPTWSMSLEIIFYLCWSCSAPLAVRACRGIASRRRRVGAAARPARGALSAIPVVWNTVAFLVAHVPFDNWPVYFGPQARFGAFAAGMALAVIVAASRRSRRCSPGSGRACCGWRRSASSAGRRGCARSGTWGQVVFHDIAALGWLLLLASTVLGRGAAWSRCSRGGPLTLAGSDQLQHLHVARADHDAARARRLIGRSAQSLPLSIALVLVASVAAGWVSFHVDRDADQQAPDAARPRRGRAGLLTRAALEAQRLGRPRALELDDEYTSASFGSASHPRGAGWCGQPLSEPDIIPATKCRWVRM